MKLFDWLYRKITEDLSEQRRIAVTEPPHAPTEPNIIERAIQKAVNERTSWPLASTDRLRELSERFTYHAPTPDQIGRYGAIRTRAKELAFLLDEKCPASIELEWALHHLDMVVMNANAAIARHTEEQGS